MAFNYIWYDTSKPHGNMLFRLLDYIEKGDDLFTDVRDVMIQMRSGDGSQVAHYDEVAARFGFTDSAKAKEAFEELDSAYSKTSGNGQVTNSRAARDQVVAKLRR